MTAQPASEWIGLVDVVAANVRAEASRRGYTQSTLARALGVTHAPINRKWLGVRPWKLEDLDQLAALFGVPAASFLLSPEYGDGPAAAGPSPSARPEGFEPPTF
ncbi:hypothetical protein FAM19031_000574 [Propionibacterium freudenreichii]|uniref:helix-turn-helix domain-containing protein n=1 Tax=Propionibacterium freudenreichii TaxID=1744 RepID=UPI00254D228C|nr:helix-turn-helix domain-containing protein [Propionibacterium freudenreichii]MDK9294536.1 hypothetical protein [Propionibacterium freudenreichii]MDK9359865.1 hypothetical protein [Propionibacterium freudenreichii]MDK9657898.1 hypothetical protein [Propionibacterium freudenreichii]WFF31051.1 hypothetical protein FAM19024_000239 [Propionibacterium freudenreichii]